MKERITKILRSFGIVAVISGWILWALDQISRIETAVNPPAWVKAILAFIPAHWDVFEPVLILSVVILLLTRERKRNDATYFPVKDVETRFTGLLDQQRGHLQNQVNSERLCRMAAALFVYTMQYKPQVEQA